MRNWSTPVAACLVAGIIAVIAPNAAAQISFSDVSTTCGIRYGTFTGRSWDVAFGDLDGDGLNELYCMAHFQGKTTKESILYRSNASLSLTNITGSAFGGVTATGGGQGCLLVDLDGDGDLDLITGSNDGVGCVFRNNGNAVFDWYVDFPGYYGALKAREISVGDMDRDGDLDVVMGTHDQRTRIATNNGSGVFSVGDLPHSGSIHTCGATMPIVADMDNDGDLDVVSQFMSAFRKPSHCSPNRPITVDLWLNDGAGVVTWASDSRGLTNGEEECTLNVADFDNDGDLDIIQIVYPTLGVNGQNRLYINDGTGHFSEEAASRGVSDASPFTDWWCKASIGDFDNDGDIDLHYRDTFWNNDGSGYFTVTTMSGINGRLSGAGDLDGDGDLDLAGPRVSNDQGFWLWRNNANNNNWLVVRVDDGPLNRYGIGAKVYVYDGANLMGYHQVISASAMQQTLEQHFGLGAIATVRVEVLFPDGTLEVRNSVAAGQRIVVTKDGGQTQPPSPPTNLSASEPDYGVARVSWTPSGDPRVTGYTVRYGTSSSQLDQSANASGATVDIPGLAQGTYFFAAEAYTASGDRSIPSPLTQLVMLGADTSPPALSSETPADGEAQVSVNSAISFTLADDKAGVDANTIVVKVDGVPVSNVTWTGNASQFTVTAVTDAALPPLSPVAIEVTASDLASAPNAMTSSWSFDTDDIVSIDEGGPTFTSALPSESTQDVAPDAQIRIAMTDEDFGVDASSVILLVNGMPVPVVTSGDPFALVMVYENRVGFAPGSVVGVHCEACDLDTPPNCNELDYSFYVASSPPVPNVVAAAIVPDGYWAGDPARALEVRDLPLQWTVRIFDLSGLEVRSYTNSTAEGTTWTWDFQNDGGQPVVRALYLVRVTDATGTIQRSGRFLVQLDP